MIKYFFNERDTIEWIELTEKEFNKKLKEFCKKYKRSLSETNEALSKDGICSFSDGEYPNVNWYSFYKYPEEIGDMEGIVAENEYDAWDCDAFAIAVALYKAGYRKVEKEIDYVTNN